MPRAPSKSRFSKVFEILQANQEKDFVRRIADPENSPFLDAGLDKEGNRQYKSHKMALEVGEALGEEPGKWYVFPTVQRDDFGEGLVDYKDWQTAWPKAKEKDDFIKFDSHKKADWFERNWKVVWGHPPRKDEVKNGKGKGKGKKGN